MDYKIKKCITHVKLQIIVFKFSYKIFNCDTLFNILLLIIWSFDQNTRICQKKIP